MRTARDIRCSERVVHVQSDMSTSETIGRMIEENADEALVFSGRRFVGVVSHLMMLKSRTDAPNDRIGNYCMPAARLFANTKLPAIAHLMLDPDINVLPDFEKEGVLKVLHVKDVLRAIQDEIDGSDELHVRMLRDVKIADWAEKAVVVGDDEKLSKVMDFMQSHKLRNVVVSSKGEVSGMVSALDIIKKYHLRHTQERQHGQIPDSTLDTTQTEKNDLLSLPVLNFTGDVRFVDRVIGFEDSVGLLRRCPLLIIDDVLGTFVITREAVLKSVLEFWEDEQNRIEFRNLDVVDESRKLYIRDVVRNYAERLPVYFNNLFELVIHFKEHQKTGQRSRFEVHCRVIYPGDNLAARADDWEPVTAMRRGLDKLERQLKSKYKDRRVEQPEYDYQAVGEQSI